MSTTTKTPTGGPKVRRLRATFLPRECAYDSAEATHVLIVPAPEYPSTKYLCDEDARLAVQRGATLDGSK